jgi:hypothetical protein
MAKAPSKAPQKTRKQRVDTTASTIKIMQGAAREIVPPAHVPLDDCDWPFWENVVAEFARTEWTEHQLELAAFLAKDMADAERNRRLLRKEGEVLTATGKANPRCNVIVAIGNRILATRRSLSLHARARGGEARDVGKRRDAAKGHENAARGKAGEEEDDLFARPTAR